GRPINKGRKGAGLLASVSPILRGYGMSVDVHRHGRGSIVALHSFRGGTGKTSITASLALAVAQHGARVAIVDTDLQSPGLHVLFNLAEDTLGRTLNGFLWGAYDIEHASFDIGAQLNTRAGRPITHPDSFFLVPASIKAGEISRILRSGYDVNLLDAGFRRLLEKLDLDYLFVDTHPGIQAETLLCLSVSDLVIVVLRPDQQDFQGTAVTIEVARKLAVPNLLLVINSVLESFDVEQVRLQAEETYAATVAGVLQRSDDLLRLASSDVFGLCFADHPWTREIGSIADRMLSMAH